MGTNLPTDPPRHGITELLRLSPLSGILPTTAPCRRRRRWAESVTSSLATTITRGAHLIRLPDAAARRVRAFRGSGQPRRDHPTQ
jgi:hypothetical protein